MNEFKKNNLHIQILTDEQETALLKGLRQSVFNLNSIWMRKCYCDDIYSLAATTIRWYTRTNFRDANNAKSRIHPKLKFGEKKKKEKKRKTESTHKELQKGQTNKKNKKEMQFCLIKTQQEKEGKTATENNSTEQYQNVCTLSG